MKYLLALTARQHQALLDATRLSSGISERLAGPPIGEDSLQFTRQELEQLADELSQAALEATEPDRRQLAAVISQLDELLDAIDREPGQSPARLRPAINSELLFQFKVTLLDLAPVVWRRFQMQDGTLGDLHRAIQAAFNWQDKRQHRFVIAGIAYGQPPDLDLGFGWGSDATDETTVRLSQLAPTSGRRARWVYQYDAGDGWRHEVLFEGYPAKEPGQAYPVCLAGEMACPPEYVGGPWGYVGFLQSIEDADTAQQDDGPKTAVRFDPEAFDPKNATVAMRKIAQNPSGE